MLDDASKLPDDPQELKSVAVQLATTVKALALEIERLKHQLAGHLRHRFGSKSEASDQLDLQLRLEEEETAAVRVAPTIDEGEPEPKEKPKRKPLPSTLPRIEEVLTPGDACACGGALRAISEDVTEELEYIPGRFIVNRIVRPRMACTGCEKIVQAALPSRPIERGRPGPGLLAHVLVNKYADHCPLYRQSQIFAREGIDLDRSTLADWVGKSTTLLEPLADSIGRSCSQRPGHLCGRHHDQNAGQDANVRRRGYGPMFVMSDPGPAKRHPLPGISSARIAKASTHRPSRQLHRMDARGRIFRLQPAL